MHNQTYVIFGFLLEFDNSKNFVFVFKRMAELSLLCYVTTHIQYTSIKNQPNLIIYAVDKVVN